MTAEALDRFLAALMARLESRRGGDDESSFDIFLGTLGALRERIASPACEAPQRESPPLPVCRFWQSALAAGTGEATDLARSVSELWSALAWVQTAGYVRNPPHPTFLENYGYAVIAGPSG